MEVPIVPQLGSPGINTDTEYHKMGQPNQSLLRKDSIWIQTKVDQKEPINLAARLMAWLS